MRTPRDPKIKWTIRNDLDASKGEQTKHCRKNIERQEKEGNGELALEPKYFSGQRSKGVGRIELTLLISGREGWDEGSTLRF